MHGGREGVATVIGNEGVMEGDGVGFGVVGDIIVGA